MKRVRLVYSWPVLVLLVLAVIFLARSVWPVWVRSRAVARERQQASEELVAWQARRAELAAEVAWLGTARGREELLREKFSVVRPGERVISVMAPPPATATPPTAPGWRARWESFWAWLAGLVQW